MARYPYTPQAGQTIRGLGDNPKTAFIAHYQQSPLAADTDGVLTALTDDGAEAVVTSFDGQPDVARCITATAGGTAGDIKAIQVTVDGTDIEGNVITEDLPAFTVNTAGTVTGSKAFATVTSVTIPAHDGTGATTAIGFGDKLGLPHKLAINTVFPGLTALDNTVEGTDPTVAVSATALESNTVDLNSAMDGNQVDLYYLVDDSNL